MIGRLQVPTISEGDLKDDVLRKTVAVPNNHDSTNCAVACRQPRCAYAGLASLRFRLTDDTPEGTALFGRICPLMASNAMQ
jgi:hypothetical protein